MLTYTTLVLKMQITHTRAHTHMRTHTYTRARTHTQTQFYRSI